MKENGLSLVRIIIGLGLMLVPVLFLPARTAALPVDSVGMQVVKGQQFVVHQVRARETFFVLARTYGVPAKTIMAANPRAKGSLKIGDLVYIPRAAKVSKTLSPTFKTDAQGNKIHQVKGKQTLFSIARQYNLSRADIKKWNKLKSDQLRTGQVLIVGLAPKPAAPALKTTDVAAKPAPGNFLPMLLANKTDQPQPPSPRKLAPANMAKVVSQIRESGLAEVIPGPEVNKYLALHHSAPVGSYVTVINRMNGRSISVRVIGTLPNTGTNEKVVVKLSKRAQQRLQALDQRFLVDVVYTPQ